MVFLATRMVSRELNRTETEEEANLESRSLFTGSSMLLSSTLPGWDENPLEHVAVLSEEIALA